MSRGFVKEDDQEEIPMVPQRAYLPDGVINFVTPAGMEQLLGERKSLISEKENLAGIGDNENERRIELNFINARLQLLNNRIASARVVNPDDQPKDEIRFGAAVTLKAEAGNEMQTITIVGVDEADISKGKISFISPVSRMLVNKKTGGRVTLKRNGKDTVFVILAIEYK
jgi:transcription elongation factor GreB